MNGFSTSDKASFCFTGLSVRMYFAYAIEISLGLCSLVGPELAFEGTVGEAATALEEGTLPANLPSLLLIYFRLFPKFDALAMNLLPFNLILFSSLKIQNWLIAKMSPRRYIVILIIVLF